MGSPVSSWGCIPGKRNSECKGPKAERNGNYHWGWPMSRRGDIAMVSHEKEVKVSDAQLGWLFVTPWTSLPRSSVHGIFQERVPEWVASPFSRRYSQARDQTWISCTAGRFFTIWATMVSKWHSSLRRGNRPYDFNISQVSHVTGHGVLAPWVLLIVSSTQWIDLGTI